MASQNKLNIVSAPIAISIDDNPAQATGVLTSDNTNVANNETVTIGSRVYTFKTTLTGAADEVLIGADADASLTNLLTLINSGRAAVAATAVLTSDNTNPTNNDTVTIGAKTYTFKTALTEVKASGTLTSDNTNVTDGDTVTIGNVTYTFKTTISPYAYLPNIVKIGADADTTLANLADAINAANTVGVAYSNGTVANPDISSSAVSAHALTLTALSIGTAGNSLALSETSSHLSVSGATLSGGAAATANQVLIGTDANTSLANLKAAVNAASGAGTTYATGTTANATISAGAIDTGAHTLTLSAITAGTAGNSLASTETSSHLSFGGATFTGGVAVSSVNTDVTSSTVAAHAITLTAITANLAGNAIATTETSAHLSFGAATLTTGGSTIGTASVGGEGGKLHRLTVVAPQLTGTPTYTIAITDVSGNQLYLSGNQNENATTNTAVELMLFPDDIIKITTSTKVEETLPFTVLLR
jgi:hypothetical protein